jgi:hypothetical protein
MPATKRRAKSYTKSSRCWPGYEPVPGKQEHEEHSCRKKPKSRNGGKEVDRETARKKQTALGGSRGKQAARKKPLSAAQHRAAVKAGHASATKRKQRSE